MFRVIHYGVGALGVQVVRAASQRQGIQLVGAVDADPAKTGKDLGDVAEVGKQLGVTVTADADALLMATPADVVIHTTSSFIPQVKDQFLGIIRAGKNVITTCEEMAFPAAQHPEAARELDDAARAAGVTVLGTGVNPGYLMDFLPVTLTSVCQEVDTISVIRVADASRRRLPLQLKIGAGMTVQEFEAKAGGGTMGHIGLIESVHLIAAALGWQLGRVETTLEPVIAEEDVTTRYLKVKAGQVTGIHQVATGMVSGRTRVTLDLAMHVAVQQAEDTVIIEGVPPIRSTIQGGVNGRHRDGWDYVERCSPRRASSAGASDDDRFAASHLLGGRRFRQFCPTPRGGTMETIDERYQRLHPRSAELFARSQRMFPEGVTHDNRHYGPFTIYIDRALGSRKWDIDGNEYVDYVMGHGSLLLGHGRPEVVAAVQAQMAKGTHYGANHELELKWGELVRKLIPSAQKVRFTSSGTEATLMALRLARAYTRKSKVIKFESHFHGWHDYAAIGAVSSSGALSAAGIPRAVAETMIVLPPNDPGAVENVLREDSDVAAIILEPTGASMGDIPIVPSFLGHLREMSSRYGVVLIFDEVVTGFRTSMGGVQAKYNVTPDMTTLAKILAGGLPGGAVVGKAEILDMIEHRDAQWDASRRVPHPGTFNANPLSASAGVAGLTLVATRVENEKADAMAVPLRRGMNEVLTRRGIPGCVSGIASISHIHLGRECGFAPEAGDHFLCKLSPGETRTGLGTPAHGVLKVGMLNHGVDLMGHKAIISSAHTEADIDQTIAAFDETLGEMLAEGVLTRRGGGK